MHINIHKGVYIYIHIHIYKSVCVCTCVCSLAESPATALLLVLILLLTAVQGRPDEEERRCTPAPEGLPCFRGRTPYGFGSGSGVRRLRVPGLRGFEACKGLKASFGP